MKKVRLRPRSNSSIPLIISPNKMREVVIRNAEEREKVTANPPEIVRLATLLQEFKDSCSNEYNEGSKWDHLVAIGDIYKSGAYPRFLPNEDMAMECYKLAASCPDGSIAGIAQAKYIEVRDHPIDAIDKAGKELPTSYGRDACDFAFRTIQQTPYSLFEKPRYSKKENQIRNMYSGSNGGETNPVFNGVEENEVYEHNFEDYDYQFLQSLQNRNTERHEYTPVVPAIFHSDSQNVHDHAVVKTIKHNIDKIAEDVGGGLEKGRSAKEEAREIILTSDVSEEDKYNALLVVDNLNESMKHSNFNVSEEEALQLIITKIKRMKDTKDTENSKEMLTRQLASAVENGDIVCSTGKIARILGTFDGVVETNEDIVAIRPMYAIKDEIANIATKIRDTYTGNNSSEKMKNDFEKQVYSEYIDNLGMSEDIIAPIVDMYKEGFD